MQKLLLVRRHVKLTSKIVCENHVKRKHDEVFRIQQSAISQTGAASGLHFWLNAEC
jgi:hypothetical protein